MKPTKRCFNCKHASKGFKVSGKTYHHCLHPKYKREDFECGKLSAWDTLMQFFDTCQDHEQKEKLTQIKPQ